MISEQASTEIFSLPVQVSPRPLQGSSAARFGPCLDFRTARGWLIFPRGDLRSRDLDELFFFFFLPQTKSPHRAVDKLCRFRIQLQFPEWVSPSPPQLAPPLCAPDWQIPATDPINPHCIGLHTFLRDARDATHGTWICGFLFSFWRPSQDLLYTLPLFHCRLLFLTKACSQVYRLLIV